MNRHEALNAWLCDFCSAYAAGSVPDGAKPPYITYTEAWGATFSENGIPVTVWGSDGTASQVNTIADAIVQALSLGGVAIRCEGGGLWLTPGDPFCTASGNLAPDRRAVYINLNVETF